MTGTPVHPPAGARAPDRDSYDAMDRGALIDRLASCVNRLDRRLLEMSDEQLDAAFLPDAGVGRWPCRVLVGHLADASVVQAHRMRRIVAEEGPVFSGWDEQAFIDAGLYAGDDSGSSPPPIAGFVGVMHALHTWLSQWLRALPDEAWSRRSLHPRHGPLTLAGTLAFTDWHFDHHVWFLDRKIGRLLGAGAS